MGVEIIFTARLGRRLFRAIGVRFGDSDEADGMGASPPRTHRTVTTG